MGVASVTAETERPVVVEPSDDVAAAADEPLLEEGSPAGSAADAAAGGRPLIEGSAGADADSEAPEDLERAAAADAAAMRGLESAS